MAKKKKKEAPSLPEGALPKPKDKKKCKHAEPCFHCQNLELKFSGMACLEESEAFWAKFQGFHDNPENPEFQGDLCEDYKEIKK